MAYQDSERTMISSPLAEDEYGRQPVGHVQYRDRVGSGGPPSRPIVVGTLALSVVLGICGGLGWALLTGHASHHGAPTARLAHFGVIQASPAGPAAVVSTPTPTPTPTPTGVPASGPFTATLLGYASHLCVGPPQAGSGTGDGALELMTCTDDLSEQFRFTPVTAGVYQITDAQTGECVDAYGAQTTDGVPVIHWQCNGGANQQWTLRLAAGGDGGDYQVVSVNSGKCLDATSMGTQPGTPLQQWDCHADPFNPANQTWRIEVSE